MDSAINAVISIGTFIIVILILIGVAMMIFKSFFK